MSTQLDRLKQAQNARRETLAQFRANQIKELTLPSGTNILVKDASMTDLMLTGKLPDMLLDIAEESASNGQASLDLRKVSKNGPEFKILLDVLTRICVVEPPIADVGDDDHLGIDEITGDDKMAIFNWANREVEQLKSFREGESEPVEALQHGDRVRLAPEPVLHSGNGNGAMDAG